jgi:hypothetical protein
MLHYDGRLYYPLSLPPYCKGFHSLSSVYTGSSEIPDTVRLVLCVAFPDNLKLFAYLLAFLRFNRFACVARH